MYYNKLIYIHIRGAFNVARFDNPGNAKALTRGTSNQLHVFMYLKNDQINLNRGRRDINRQDDYGNFDNARIGFLFGFLYWWRYTF